MAVNPNTDFTAGDVLTAAQQNRFPRGIVGEASYIGGTVGLTSTMTDLPSMSVTFTAVANRLYKISFTCQNAMSTASTNRMAFQFTDGSNNVITNIYHGGLTYGFGITFTELIAPSAGSYTVKARARYDVGTGGDLYSAANSPMRLFVEDLGPI